MPISRGVLDAWLADLRDPANQSLQGRGCLRSVDDKFCCLGRLANIVDPNGWTNVDPTAPSMWKHTKGQGYLGANSFPEPHDIFIRPDLIPVEVQEKLSDLNDGNGSGSRPALPFPRIADTIEELVASGQIPVVDDPS